MESESTGSLWRKWDLQVQTRVDQNYTCLGINLAVDKLTKLATATGLTEAEIKSQEVSMTVDKYAKLFVHYVGLFTDIQVIAVTDHNTGEELDALMQAAADSPYELTILPGVEVASSHGIHILCIFDPTKKWKDTWASCIDHFLTEIGLTSARFNANQQPQDATSTSQQIIELVAEKGGVSIFAHVGTGRGLFVQTNTANGGNAHIGIYTHKECQIVQIPHSGNLPVGTANIINGHDPQYGSKIVTQIQCSDSRKLSDIGEHFTWIKADPTLAGLKQIIYEPELRVKLQADSPEKDNSKLALADFSISNSDGFKLTDQSVPLNRDLVAIIGGRGSGKSLLLETIAALNEEHATVDVNGKTKVIESLRKAGAKAKISVTLKNKDGDEEEFSKLLADTTRMDLPILYIGQEKLSSIATDDSTLTPTVAAFLGIKDNTIEAEKIESIIAFDISQIDRFNEQQSGLRQKYSKNIEDDSKPFPEQLKTFREKKEKQANRLTSEKTDELVQQLRAVINQGQKIRNAIERLPNLEGEIDNLPVNKSIDIINEDLAELATEPILSIPKIETSVQVKAIKAATEILVKKKDDLAREYKRITEELIKLGVKEDVRLLTESIKKLQDEITEIDEDIKAYDVASEELTTYRNELMAMGLAFQNLVDWRAEEINKAFTDFTATNALSDASEQELFNSIIEGVKVEGEIVFDDSKFLQLLKDECFDGRAVKDIAEVRQAIMGNNSGEPIAFAEFISFWKDGNVWPLLEKQKFTKNGRENFIDIIYKQWHEYISVRTKISLDDVPIERLSVGQRGTLLLKIYLASATDKQIFIIDQPEDNLDNKFITTQMVPMLRKIKQSRQVILSTHNANIVVGCDADQIVVAKLDENTPAERLYMSGSIENETINQYIQSILEGGSKALADRYRRYM